MLRISPGKARNLEPCGAPGALGASAAGAAAAAFFPRLVNLPLLDLGSPTLGSRLLRPKHSRSLSRMVGGGDVFGRKCVVEMIM